MSIYSALSTEIPIIAYSVMHQHKKNVTVKEYIKSIQALRSALKGETDQIKAVWESYIADMTAKIVQTTRGNLSQFLSTPLQSDTSEIHRIIKEQVVQTSSQLLPNTHFGLLGGYDAKYLNESHYGDIPKTRMTGGRAFLQKSGFILGKNNPNIFESIYLIQGGANLDILEYIVRKRIGIYESAHGKKSGETSLMASSLHNLIFLDGTLESEGDRFEFQLNFIKGEELYNIFHQELTESMKYFRTEIHNLNVSVWQRKLGLGAGAEFILRIRTKDRSTLRSVISITQKFIKNRNKLIHCIASGSWLVKEFV
jgi:hypothetical protein